MSVSANQAVVALHEARLRDEQKRVTKDLDRSVAERTKELSTANAALEREVAERRRVQDVLRETALDARAAIDGIPGLAATWSLKKTNLSR